METEKWKEYNSFCLSAENCQGSSGGVSREVLDPRQELHVLLQANINKTSVGWIIAEYLSV